MLSIDSSQPDPLSVPPKHFGSSRPVLHSLYTFNMFVLLMSMKTMFFIKSAQNAAVFFHRRAIYYLVAQGFLGIYSP